uniref:Uncharacterized protein n=1 Tax=Panagrolaimus sp. JU765 TaxID=591449 RepID=A0AC34RQ18_9BILA
MQCGNYLEMIKKEIKDFTSYTVFTPLSIGQKAIIYGRYLSSDSIQTLLKLPEYYFPSEIQSNTFNFKINKVIPSYRAIDTYRPQTRLIGIDLGANKIVVSVSRNASTELVKIDQEYSMPSVISFVEDEPIIGNVARKHLTKNPELVLSDLKHLRTHMDGYDWPFGHCIEPKKSTILFQTKSEFKQYSTVEIYQILFQKLKQSASEYQSDLNEGKDVNQAVITVPDFDNELMLEDIFEAAESIQLEILDIITETQADMLYFLSKEMFSKDETVIVVDIGGETSFVGKFSFKKGIRKKHDFLLFCGNTINGTLESQLKELFYERFKIHASFTLEEKLQIEKIKEDFTFKEELLLPATLIKYKVVLTRNWFEKQVLDPILGSLCNQSLTKILKDEIYSSNISKVFLVGGTCRIPYIQKYFKTIFGEEKVVIPDNSQEVRATGALIHGLKVLNGEHQPVFQRKGIKRHLDWDDSEDESTDNEAETDSLLKTGNEPFNFFFSKQ